MATFVTSIKARYFIGTIGVLAISLAVALTLGLWQAPESSAQHAAENLTFTPPTQGFPVEADYPSYASLGQMKQQADAVIKGTAVSAEQRDINAVLDDNRDQNPDYISYWVSKIRVDKVIKGDLAVGDVVEVKQLITGEPIGMGESNRSGVLFLKFYPYGIPASPLNPYQGVVPISNGMARPLVDDASMPKGLSEDAFVARIR